MLFSTCLVKLIVIRELNNRMNPNFYDTLTRWTQLSFPQKPSLCSTLPQQFLMSNRLETAMWLSRLFTVYCSIMFILPIMGWVQCHWKAFDHLWFRSKSHLFPSPSVLPSAAVTCVTAGAFQTLCSCKLLPAGSACERSHQCPSFAPEASSLPVE